MDGSCKRLAALATIAVVIGACEQPLTSPLETDQPPGLAEAAVLEGEPNESAPEVGVMLSEELTGPFWTPRPRPRNRVLIYGPSLAAPTSYRPHNEQTIAEKLGYSVTVADELTWAAMTTADFASYTAIVFGDRTCAVGTSTLATAEATKGTWSRAVTGPVYVQGADPQYHASYREEARHMIAAGLNFAAHGYRTGLYASLSCYYAGAPRYTTVDFLSEVGHFEVGPQEGCPNTVNVLHPGHPAMAGQTDAGLSNWGCTAHDLLLVYPAGFHALATVVRPSDGAVLPFIVARGGPFGP